MDYSITKIHRIKFAKDGTLLALPKTWDRNKFSFTLKLPDIRPDPWHFSIQLGYNSKRENIFLHCHWTNEQTHTHEPILEIYFSTKSIDNFLAPKNLEASFQNFFQDLQQEVTLLLKQSLKVFQSMSRKDNFFLYYVGPFQNEKEMLQHLLGYLPYEEPKKQLSIPDKLTPSIRKKLNMNLLKPIDNLILKPGLYMSFLMHPNTFQKLDIGFLIVEEVSEKIQGYFLLKPHIPIIARKLFKPIYKPLWETTESLVKPDKIVVKWKGVKIPSVQIKEYIHKYFIDFKRSVFKQIIWNGLEARFLEKGYKYKFKPQFEWGSPFSVAYKGNKRVIVALAWTQAEIPKMVDSLLLFRSKYKAKNSIFITPDKKIAHECLRKHNLEKNILLLSLEPQIFINMFYKVIH